MRIALRRRIGRLKVSLVIGVITKVTGINSTLKDGNHILMWEWDSTSLRDVKRWLMAAQARHSLPPVHVARSHPGGGFHAYCFTRLPWLETVHIVSGTEGVDPAYVSMCAMRGHWTLRLTDKGQGAPKAACTLMSTACPTATPQDLASYVEYEAWSKKGNLTLGKRGL